MPDVQTADRKKMKRARAPEFLLNVLRQRGDIAEHHCHKQVGDCRIVHSLDQRRSQSSPCLQREGDQWVPLRGAQDACATALADA